MTAKRRTGEPRRVRITTDRGPWHGGRPLARGEVAELDRETAGVLVGRGWAEDAGGAEKADG